MACPKEESHWESLETALSIKKNSVHHFCCSLRMAAVSIFCKAIKYTKGKIKVGLAVPTWTVMEILAIMFVCLVCSQSKTSGCFPALNAFNQPIL